MDSREAQNFRRKIWQYYRAHGRAMPWRKTRDPYRIFVSEIMLQQTQVDRVREKYLLFLKTFPDFETLAAASLREVLEVWQGLGYNRRAGFLWRSAQVVVQVYKGKLPQREEELLALPGIGRGTAGSVAAFVFNAPVIFIETNIRRVFIHEFFKDKKGVSDDEIRELVGQTLDKKNPREWYYALMDYGAYLGRELAQNPNTSSRIYRKQATFKGSKRETRGAIIRVLLGGSFSLPQLVKKSEKDEVLIRQALTDLEKEGVVTRQGERYALFEK